jgi:hypothetical protein
MRDYSAQLKQPLSVLEDFLAEQGSVLWNQYKNGTLSSNIKVRAEARARDVLTRSPIPVEAEWSSAAAQDTFSLHYRVPRRKHKKTEVDEFSWRREEPSSQGRKPSTLSMKFIPPKSEITVKHLSHHDGYVQGASQIYQALRGFMSDEARKLIDYRNFAVKIGLDFKDSPPSVVLYSPIDGEDYDCHRVAYRYDRYRDRGYYEYSDSGLLSPKFNEHHAEQIEALRNLLETITDVVPTVHS